MSRVTLSAAVVGLLLGAGVASAAPYGFEAGGLKPDTLGAIELARYYGGQPDHVFAESRYGHGRVSGPVRRGPRGGFEVRMPGGTWIDCARNCAETLRRETVDFWESRSGRNDPVDGPGYLRWGW